MQDQNPSPAMQEIDLWGEELNAQRFQMLEDIACELAGEVTFPTDFDTIMQLRDSLQSPHHTHSSIAKTVACEPLLSAKILNLANSTVHNPTGKIVKTLKQAVSRLGVNTVRNEAISIIAAQLLSAKGMAEFRDITHGLWKHSIRTAAAAKVIAQRTSSLNPDQAMLAGLFHDLGAFYMLYRASQYEELRSRPDSLRYLIMHWHESIGTSLLSALGLPNEIVESCFDHDHPRPTPSPAQTYADIVYIANMLAGGHFEWLMQDMPAPDDLIKNIETEFRHLLPEIEALTAEIHAQLN